MKRAVRFTLILLHLEDNAFSGELTDAFVASHDELLQLDISSNQFTGFFTTPFVVYAQVAIPRLAPRQPSHRLFTRPD
jgi:hypothetical protein